MQNRATLTVIMVTHADLALTTLLRDNLKSFKKKFDCLLLESVPNHLSGEHVLQYLRNILLVPNISLTNFANVPPEHVDYLLNIYADNISDHEKILLKCEAISAFMQRHGKHINAEIKARFNQYYYYHFVAEALKAGFPIVGIESQKYFPGSIPAYKRDMHITYYTKKRVSENKNCLLVIGAGHGAALIQAYKNETFKNNYLHLYSHHDEIDNNFISMLFKKEIEEGNYALSKYQSYSFLALSQYNDWDKKFIIRKEVLGNNTYDLIYHSFAKDKMRQQDIVCKQLAIKSQLPFFTALHTKTLVTDAVLEINNEVEKAQAVSLNKKIGLGRFFKSDKGQDMFVIEDTNATDRAALLHQRINALK
ncbi:MAG: hypothetical protein JO149_07600 [Gammaproteobacteria bacterium]|nr:hypothetical protein [Gammaproteobacteria bacterium]